MAAIVGGWRAWGSPEAMLLDHDYRRKYRRIGCCTQVPVPVEHVPRWSHNVRPRGYRTRSRLRDMGLPNQGLDKSEVSYLGCILVP